MKHILYATLVFVVGCGHSSSTTTSVADKVPVAVTPNTSVSSPAPTIVWPPADAVQTSTFGGYSCAVTANSPQGGLTCDTGTATYTQPSPYTNEVDSVLVGNGIICAMLDGYGAPTACETDLADCTNAPVNAGVVCWTPDATTPVLMNVNAQNGYTDQTLYNYGPASYSVDASGTVCITESIYDVTSTPYGAWIKDVTNCGTTIGAGGFLE